MYNVLTLPLGLAATDSLGPMLGAWPSVLGDGMYQVAFVFLCMGLGVGIYGSFVVRARGFMHSELARCSLVGTGKLINAIAVRYHHDDMRLSRYLVLDNQAPLQRGRRAEESQVESVISVRAVLIGAHLSVFCSWVLTLCCGFLGPMVVLSPRYPLIRAFGFSLRVSTLY